MPTCTALAHHLVKVDSVDALNSTIQQLCAEDAVVIIDHQLITLYPLMYQHLSSSKTILGLLPVTAGEALKTLERYTEITQQILDLGIHRQTTLIAIGGGTVTDFGGFVAATLLRGLSWLAIPTTLTGMIDAAIGGKVGINTPAGKNLIGGFHSPQHVLIAPEWLSSFTTSELLSHCGELIKYGLMCPKLNQLILAGTPPHDPSLIRQCIELKYRYVDADPLEHNSTPTNLNRAALNLGHTIAHALELSYELSHSSAVLLGLLLEPYLLADSSQATAASAIAHQTAMSWQLMGAYNLQAQCSRQLKMLRVNWQPHLIYQHLQVDKKRTAHTLKIVLVNRYEISYHQLPFKQLIHRLIPLIERLHLHHSLFMIGCS